MIGVFTMPFSVLIIIFSIFGALFTHYFTLFKMKRNDDFLETKAATILSTVESACRTNISWCILLMTASFIVENETTFHIKNEIPTFIFSNRYWLLLLLSAVNAYKMALEWNEIVTLKRKEKNSQTPVEDLQHMLQITEKRKELSDRKLNLLKSFSFIPVLLLFVNNLSSLKETNPTLNFGSLLLLNKLNIYILLGILGYFFLSYNTFDKCQLRTRQEIYILNRINFLSLTKNSPEYRISELRE